MRISKRLILKTAEELRRERGEFTQIELHEAIERKLGRELGINEKRRVTMIIRNEYCTMKVEEQSRQRIIYFL